MADTTATDNLCLICGIRWIGAHVCNPTPSATNPFQPPPLTEQRIREIIQDELRKTTFTTTVSPWRLTQ